jgi:hypothetical protein
MKPKEAAAAALIGLLIAAPFVIETLKELIK